MTDISRREFGAILVSGVLAGRLGAPFTPGDRTAPAVTAAAIVERIRQRIGVEWRDDTVDAIKAGDPTTVVTGVATTAMATLAVLRRAVESGANLVVTCEPTFYGRADSRTPPRPDPVHAAKHRFIAEHRLVVFRLRDHWRARAPDPFVQGLADAFGWGARRVPDDATPYDIPVVPLDDFALRVQRRLGARGGLRVVGDPRTRVRRVALLPGSTPLAAALRALPTADVVVAGEVREWETVEYVRDLVSSGAPKGLVLVGRVVSEDPGMGLCARWLRTVVPEVPVGHLPTGDPYWRPGP